MMHNIAFVGYGGMAAWHHRTLSNIDNIQIAGVWDIHEKGRTKAANAGLHNYHSLQDLLSDETVDLVLIATPNDVHKSIAIDAMRAGKHVVCEKPVTLSSADLQEMITVSEETGKFLTVHQNRRWDKDFRVVKKIIADGTLGEIFRIESRVHGSRGIPGDWRHEKQHGGGMVLDWGVHLLDQALLMYPDAKVNTVYATLTNVTNQNVDDGFQVDLHLSNGVHFLVEVGTSNFIELPRWYVLGANGTAVVEDWQRNGKIVCASGVDETDVVPVVTAAGLTKTMAPRREDSIFTYPLPEVDSDILDFYRNVAATIEGRETSLIQLPEVMRVMKLMEAIFTSAQNHQVVTFE